MKVKEILDETALLIHHDIPNVRLVSKLNQISRQLFREFKLPDKIYKFQTTTIPYYDIPDDCAEDRVRSVVIDGCEYEKLSPEVSGVTRPFCTVFVGKLFINPNPVGKDAYLYYRPRHTELSAANLNAVPSFPEDYHELLVYGLAKWIAGIQRDVDMVNNFQNEYDEIYTRARKGLRKMGLKRAKETMIW